MRRMVFLILALVSLVAMAGECLAASETLVPFRRDKKFLEEGKLFSIQWINPAAPDTNAVVDGDVALTDSCVAGTYTLSAAEAALFPGAGTTRLGTRGVARTVSVTVAARDGTAANVAAGTVTVYGTNILDATISEAFTLTNNTENSQQGAVAFKTLTRFTYTAMDEDSVGISIGIGENLGLWHTLPVNSLIAAFNAATKDASATLTADADEIEKNTINYDSNPSGTTEHTVFYWIPPFNVNTSADKY